MLPLHPHYFASENSQSKSSHGDSGGRSPKSNIPKFGTRLIICHQKLPMNGCLSRPERKMDAQLCFCKPKLKCSLKKQDISFFPFFKWGCSFAASVWKITGDQRIKIGLECKSTLGMEARGRLMASCDLTVCPIAHFIHADFSQTDQSPCLTTQGLLAQLQVGRACFPEKVFSD